MAIAHEIGYRYGECNSLVNLGDTYIQLGQIAQACEQYKNAIHIADETGNKQNQHEAHFGFAWARLLIGELTAASEAIEMARIHDYPSNNAAMWTLMRIIQLRQAERAAAREAFSRGLAEANKLMKKFDKNQVLNSSISITLIRQKGREKSLQALANTMCRIDPLAILFGPVGFQ